MKTKMLAAVIAATFSAGAMAQIGCNGATPGQWMPAWGSMSVWRGEGASGTDSAYHGTQYLYWDNVAQMMLFKWSFSNSKLDATTGQVIYAGGNVSDGTFKLTTVFDNGLVPGFFFDRSPAMPWETTLPSPFMTVTADGNSRRVSIGTSQAGLLEPRRMYWTYAPMVGTTTNWWVPGRSGVSQYATVGRVFPANMNGAGMEYLKDCTNIENNIPTLTPGWFAVPSDCIKFWNRNWANPNLPEGVTGTAVLDQTPSRVTKAPSLRLPGNRNPNDPRSRKLRPPNEDYFDPEGGLIQRPGGPGEWGTGQSYC